MGLINKLLKRGKAPFPAQGDTFKMKLSPNRYGKELNSITRNNISYNCVITYINNSQEQNIHSHNGEMRCVTYDVTRVCIYVLGINKHLFNVIYGYKVKLKCDDDYEFDTLDNERIVKYSRRCSMLLIEKVNRLIW